jgi:hypothetical protein
MTTIQDMTELAYRELLAREVTNVRELLRRVGFILARRPNDPLTSEVGGRLAVALLQLDAARNVMSLIGDN